MNDKKRVLNIFLRVGLIILIVVFFFIINDIIDGKNKSSFRHIGNSNEFAYQVEDVRIENQQLIVEGWFFELKSVQNVPKDIEEKKNLGIILYDLNTEEISNVEGPSRKVKGMAFSVERKKRLDINDYFKCEYDYSDCGFIAKLDVSGLDIEKGQYQIVFKPDEYGIDGIQTDAFIENGKLSFVNPKEKFHLEIGDTELEDIISNGYCIMTCPEYHICVYQYEKKLYWIVEEGFEFEESGKTAIQYQLDTTQFDKLPEKSRLSGQYYGNNSFVFEEYEITNSINCGQYRVAVVDIPQEYAVTRFVTGARSNGKWIWIKYFRPVFMYD